MTVRIKRIYDKTATSDGARILVDRLWPRGISKDEASITYWAKELAPSDSLRKWFHADPDKRFKDFQKKYRAELQKNRSLIEENMLPYNRKRYTLITAVKDIEHSHIPILSAFLDYEYKN